jgi:uncharacterized protein YjiS (DUF1127 family)
MSDNDLDRLVRNYRRLTPMQYTRLRERAAARAKALRTEFLRNLFARLFTWRRRRAAIAELSALDDESLKDIGLHRSGIEAAVRRDLPPRFADAA